MSIARSSTMHGAMRLRCAAPVDTANAKRLSWNEPREAKANRRGRFIAPIAPTMPTMNEPAKRVHSRGDGLSSPWGGALFFALGWGTRPGVGHSRQKENIFMEARIITDRQQWNDF